MPSFDRLFIAEKGSAAQTLAEYLGKTSGKPVNKQGGYYVIGNDRIAPMSGHLLEKAEAHIYDPKYKEWAVAHLPIIPKPFKLVVKPDQPEYNIFPGRRIKAIKELLQECTSVVGYGDPDSEGQLLQDELLIYLNNRKPVIRLWANALDDTSLSRALANMRPNEEYRGYYESALCRSDADWLYGINETRALTCHARAAGGDFTVNIGRVQTPTGALVVERELAIRHHVKVDYYVPFIGLASQPGFKGTWQPRKNDENKIDDPRVDDEGRLIDKPAAEAVVASAKAAGQALVVNVETTAGTEAAKLPFSTGSLQAHCSTLYGFSAKQTLDIAQSLYLKKLTSYPRVNTTFLPESQHADAPRILASIAKAQLPTAMSAALLGAKPALKSKTWNDSKVTAHHAIIPAHLDRPADISQLSDIELKVYLEIVKRYILQFWPVAKFNATEVLMRCGTSGQEEHYTARGKRYIDEGWRKAFAATKADVDDEEDAGAAPTLPALTKGQLIPLAAAGMEAKQTQPPKRYTDATLITAMETIYLHVKDPEYRKRLQAKDSGGIGTSATRGPMVDQMVKRGQFLQDKEKFLTPSEHYIEFMSLLPSAMKSPDMTAMWNLFIDDVQAGKASYDAFMAKMIPWVTKMVGESSTYFVATQFSATKTAKPRIAETAFTCFGELGLKGCGSPLKHIPSGKTGSRTYPSFFGCSNDACKKVFSDTAGKPVERQPAAPVDKTHACRTCQKGFLVRRARNDNSGFFWSCSTWRDTKCPAIVSDLDGQPDFDGKAQPSDKRYPCGTCGKGFLLRRARNDKSGHFWGCSAFREAGCRAGANDVNGEPDLAGAAAKPKAADPADNKHPCEVCNKGFLRLQQRRDNSGSFWGCSAFREGCKAMCNDADGEPDVAGKGNSTWKNGAPASGPKVVKPRNSGHSSGFRGGRPTTPQMNGPAPK